MRLVKGLYAHACPTPPAYSSGAIKPRGQPPASAISPTACAHAPLHCDEHRQRHGRTAEARPHPTPERSLPELAHELAISPHRLSRIFRSITGHTISRHRMRLRARAALERLTGGEHHIA
jgi:AraC-like DNA-binding protein